MVQDARHLYKEPLTRIKDRERVLGFLNLLRLRYAQHYDYVE